MNPYEVLGVERGATDKQVKAKYRRLSSLHHPDKSTGDAETFHRIKEAYDVLSDPARRSRYDRTGRTDENKVTPERIKSFIAISIRTVIEASRPDGSSDDPVFENIRDKMILGLAGARVEIKNNIFKTQRKLERAERLVERFKAKEQFDPVGDALKAEKKRLEEELNGHQDAFELSSEVEKVLKTYVYEVGPGPEGQFSPGPTNRPRGGYRLTSRSFA